jgi:hypothetical protein
MTGASGGASAPTDAPERSITPTEAGTASIPSTPRPTFRRRELEQDVSDARRNIRGMKQIIRLGNINIRNLSDLSNFAQSSEDVSFIALSEESEDDLASTEEEEFTGEITDVAVPMPQLGAGMTAAERRAVRKETFDYNKPKCVDCGRFGHLSKASQSCPHSAVNCICKHCSQRGHRSSTSQKCSNHPWYAGAPPSISDDEKDTYYARKIRACYKSELTKMVNPTFVVGSARFDRQEFTNKINEYVKYLSITIFEFSEALHLFYDSRARNQLPPTLDLGLLKSLFRAFVGTTERQKGAGLFRAFLNDEIFPQRAEHGMKLQPMTHASGFIDALMRTYFTNIKSHLTQNLMAAFGRYFVTYLRKECGISKKSAKKGKAIFYAIFSIAYEGKGSEKENVDDNEDAREKERPLFYERELSMADWLEDVDEEEDEGQLELSNSKCEVQEGARIEVPNHRRKYIEGELPPRKLFAKRTTRMEQGKPLTTKKRRNKKAKQMVNKGKEAGARREGEESVKNPKFFNTKRTMNKKDRQVMRNAKNTERHHTTERGRPADIEELRNIAQQFFEQRASNLNNLSLKITAMKEINLYLGDNGIRQYCLIPKQALRAKHLSINPTSLYQVLRSFGKPGLPSREHFMENIQTILPTIFKLANKPDSLLSQTGLYIKKSFTFNHYQNRFTFANLITTDGKDASVGIYRWVKSRINHDGTNANARSVEKLERKKICLKAKSMLESGATLMGIDPGRKDIVTAQVEGCLYKKPKRKCTYTLSIVKWAEISKRNWRAGKVKSWLHRAKLYYWLQNIPSNPKERIRYLYNPDSSFGRAAEFFLSLKYRQLRRDERMSHHRAAKRVANEIVSTAGEIGRTKVVIAFGNAKFSQTTRGFAPGGRVADIFNELKRMPNVLPIYVDEFHTSQVCNVCVKTGKAIFKVVGLGTVEDLYAPRANYSPIDNPWHVRRCMGCSLRYNRDENSAQNMCLRLREAIAGGGIFGCFDRENGKIPLKRNL